MTAIPGEMLHPGWYIAIAAALAIVPLILGTATSYLKINLALGVLRNGFGAQQVPNNTIIMVLSLVLSVFIMEPVMKEISARAGKIDLATISKNPLQQNVAIVAEVVTPWFEFLKSHSGEREKVVLYQLSQRNNEEKSEEGTDETGAVRIVLPAFVLTELKEGLMMGFVLLLPFLVVDLVVANILAGLGMYMMSPTIISLPLKLLLFVSVDGWLLVSRGFIASYTGAP